MHKCIQHQRLCCKVYRRQLNSTFIVENSPEGILSRRLSFRFLLIIIDSLSESSEENSCLSLNSHTFANNTEVSSKYQFSKRR